MGGLSNLKVGGAIEFDESSVANHLVCVIEASGGIYIAKHGSETRVHRKWVRDLYETCMRLACFECAHVKHSLCMKRPSA